VNSQLKEKIKDGEILKRQRFAARPSSEQLFSEASRSKEACDLQIYRTVYEYT